jgi:hypothetical protein
MLLADLRPTSSLLLTLRGLPPPQLPATLRVAAITLVPTPRLEDVTAALAQTDSFPKLWAPGRRGPGKRMLRVSQGSCYLPLGPPEGLAKVTRALFFLPSPLDGVRLQFTNLGGRRGKEGDREGHRQIFLPPRRRLKDTKEGSRQARVSDPLLPRAFSALLPQPTSRPSSCGHTRSIPGRASRCRMSTTC